MPLGACLPALLWVRVHVCVCASGRFDDVAMCGACARWTWQHSPCGVWVIEQHTQHAGVSDVAVMGSWQPALHVLGASECMTHILDSLDQLIHVSDMGSELVPAMPCHDDGNL